MAKVVCFGEALIDLTERTAGPGQPPCYEQYAGGAPANVAAAVARLGGEGIFVGMLSEDRFGGFLLESLREAGVDTRYVRRTGAAQTALAFVALDAEGERSFSFYRSPAADELFRAEHFDDGCFAGAAVFHACSNTLTSAPLASATVEGMTRARRAGALVSFDVNLRPALWDAGADPHPPIREAMAAADLVKLSRPELEALARPLGGEQALLARLWGGRTRLAVVTDGARPLRFFTPDGEGSLPVFPVRAVDSTAAGDAFAGGFLYWLADRSPFDVVNKGGALLEAGLRFAAACGAAAVTRRGSFAAMPRHETLRRFLEDE